MAIFHENPQFSSLFGFNQFSENIEFLSQPEWDKSIQKGDMISDDDITGIRYYISDIHHYEPSKQIVGEACLLTSKRRSYHPVKNYIESVKWDGVSRIDSWLRQAVGCEDNVYTQMAGAKFLIAAVNRVYRPGCKFDHMLILEGGQGLGKSTLVEEMAGDWYLDTNFGHKDKDLIDGMRGAFLIEISELTGMNKKDVDWLKSFLTKKVDRVRLAYAARTKDFKRKSVFIGTYNPSGNNMYLRDDTGNRRFWPVECTKVDLDYVRKNKAQLWAEAYARYKEGEVYYLTDPEAVEILTGMHSERELESPTHVKIRNWLEQKPRREVSMHELIEECLKINTDGRNPKEVLSVSTTVGIIMRKLRWTKGTNYYRHMYYNPAFGGNGGPKPDPEPQAVCSDIDWGEEL
jgi:putative DNA primase/helicase